MAKKFKYIHFGILCVLSAISLIFWSIQVIFIYTIEDNVMQWTETCTVDSMTDDGALLFKCDGDNEITITKDELSSKFLIAYVNDRNTTYNCSFYISSILDREKFQCEINNT